MYIPIAIGASQFLLLLFDNGAKVILTAFKSLFLSDIASALV